MLIRIKYAKTEEGRFLSHLDLMRAWERAIRRSGAPLGFSQGFNPHPKLSFGSALAVGTTSNGEYMDVELTKEVDLPSLEADFVQALPPALLLLAIKQIPEKSPSLMSVLNRAHYVLRVDLVAPIEQMVLDKVMADFLAQEEVTVLRFKKNSKDKRPVNIRPGVFDLQGEAFGETITITILVQSGSEGNVRPEEVIYGLMSNGLPIVKDIIGIHREGLYIAQGDQLVTPLEAEH